MKLTNTNNTWKVEIFLCFIENSRSKEERTQKESKKECREGKGGEGKGGEFSLVLLWAAGVLHQSWALNPPRYQKQSSAIFIYILIFWLYFKVIDIQAKS